MSNKTERFDVSEVNSPWSLAKKLRMIFRFVEVHSSRGADLAKVEYAAVNGILGTLDPHSLLLDPEMSAEMDVNTGGEFGGLGIVIRMIRDKLTVVKPMPNTPASRAGVRANDVIVRINNDPTENLTVDESIDRMRGKPGSTVTLWVSRKNVKKTGQNRHRSSHHSNGIC